MRIAQQSIEQVREAADIVEVASEFTALKRQGTRFTGLCPYPDHSEKTPSFSVSPERGFYYCFGCSRGGDAIKLVSELKALSFVEAVSYLADRSNIELQFEGAADDSQAVRKRNLRRRSIHRALAAAAVYYHKVLLRSPSAEAEAARRYLKKRGISNSTIGEFRLGYAPPRGKSGFVAAAGRLELGREILDAAGLLSRRGGERFAGRVTFPISDRRGRIVGFGARALGEDHPKYLNSPETEVFDKRNLLYGFPQVSEAIRRERTALVVEGYTDVLMLYQSGIKNVVATLGTATTPAHLRSLSGYADRIYVLFDPDAAGERAVERAATTAAELKLDLRVLRLPQDPADWLLEHPAEEFAALLSKAVSALAYVFRRRAEQARGASAAERSRVVEDVKSFLREIEDPVFQREGLRLATEALGVGPHVLQSVPASSPSTTAARGSLARPDVPKDPLEEAGRDVLALMLTRPDLTSKPLSQGVPVPSADPLFLQPEDFAGDGYARLFHLLQTYAGRDLDALLADGEARPFMDQIGALAAAGDRLYPSETSVQEAWLRLGVLSRQRRKRETPDYGAKEQLQAEIQLLKEALRAVAARS